MPLRIRFVLILIIALAGDARAAAKHISDDLFTGPVPSFRIEIPPEGIQTLRQYQQVWRQERPQRTDVRATVRFGDAVYTDVAVHLKGSYSFQPIDGKPSLTLNFDKFVPGRHFHGLSKIHLNNAVQDASGLSEQLARNLFAESGMACPRATPARVTLNGRDLGICVLVEGANQSWVHRNFDTDEGNLYDAGSGIMDIDQELPLLSGKQPADRADLKALVEAAQERDPASRLERLGKVLDIDKFITFAALEMLLVHWDGYCAHTNNYRVFHDFKSDKFVFIPHGMDQLFGQHNTPDMSLTPAFKGIVARGLLSIPEARTKYFKRVEELSKKSFSVEALHARVDKLAERLRAAIDDDQRGGFENAVDSLKSRIEQRGASVARQLATQAKPLKFAEDGTAALTGWRFKPDQSSMAQGNRAMVGGQELLRLRGTFGEGTGGSWRTGVLLDEGHYVFTGQARTRGMVDANREVSGIMFRISGETRTDGFALADGWKTYNYEFDIRGEESVELVCEFRGPPGGVGEIDAASLKLVKKAAEKTAKPPLR